MEDKKNHPQESMALIAQMIESSKQRVAMPDLHISIMWAVLTILTAATVLTGMLLFHSPWINLVWFAIPAIECAGKYHNGKEVRSGERREDTD